MRKFVTSGSIAIILVLLALPGSPAMAEEEKPGNLAWIVHLDTKADMGSKLEEGMKAHNSLHAGHSDPVAIYTWQIITGPNNGDYIRATLGQHWKDFDGDPAHLAEDTADGAKNIAPYVDSATPTIWQLQLDLSNPASSIPALSRVITFHVRPGHEDAFRQAIGKIHKALSERDWDPYLWFGLVDGGRMPTYMVILPRDNFAGFDPGDKTMDKAMMEAYGEEAGKIFADFQATVESMQSHITAYRPDLSYLPKPGSE